MPVKYVVGITLQLLLVAGVIALDGENTDGCVGIRDHLLATRRSGGLSS